MDFGHYERFLWNESMGVQSISMGKIYAGILEKERRGDFLWKTVQMIPHVTDHICERIEQVFSQVGGDVCLIEVGGTVGDIEVELYLEAIRQMKRHKRKEDFIHIHLTYVPIPGWVDEQKTKPTQQSINLLQSKWLFPEIIIARWKEELTQESREKIALFSNLREERVFSIPDVASVYTIPSILEKQSFDSLLEGKLNTWFEKARKTQIWEELLSKEKKTKMTVGIIWKYMALEDSYSSVVAALEHVSMQLGLDIEILFLDTREGDVVEQLSALDACIIPGGFWNTGIENMLSTIRYVRENKIPCLGICLGMQLMIIEFCRNILNIPRANSLEFDEHCHPYDVITLLEDQKELIQLWGTMRLWKQSTLLDDWQIYNLYKKTSRLQKGAQIYERFRHRYEVNPLYADKIEHAWLKISGRSKRQQIVQCIEMDPSIHPYFVGTQAHPELTSRLEDPAPLFLWLMESTMK